MHEILTRHICHGIMSVVLLAIFKAGGSAVFIQSLHSKQCCHACFNPNLGQIWTNL